MNDISGATGNAPTHFCTTCGDAFAAAEERKQHHFEDRHVYNVKRKLEGIAPISKLLWDEKI